MDRGGRRPAALARGAVAATPAEAELLVEGTAATFSFREWASSLGLNRFVGLICSAGLDDYIDSCETALTIFAPSDLAIERLAQTGGLPSAVCSSGSPGVDGGQAEGLGVQGHKGSYSVATRASATPHRGEP